MIVQDRKVIFVRNGSVVVRVFPNRIVKQGEESAEESMPDEAAKKQTVETRTRSKCKVGTTESNNSTDSEDEYAIQDPNIGVETRRNADPSIILTDDEQSKRRAVDILDDNSEKRPRPDMTDGISE